MHKSQLARFTIQAQLAISILLWGYIIYRAFSISITFDEAYTYLLVKTNNWRRMAGTANTHWLNSLFGEIMLWLPGPDHPWKLRMLSVLSWPVYVFSALKISDLFKNRMLGLLFFLFIVGNPFLIAYFSLARGYAAATAFVMLALWLASKLITCQELKPQKWVVVFMAAGLASVANFSAFYFFMGLTAIYMLRLLQKRSFHLIASRSSLPLNVLIVGVFVFSITFLLILNHFKVLDYGGKSYLVDSMFGSMVRSFSYLDNPEAHYRSKGIAYLLYAGLLPAEQWIGRVIFIFFAFAVLFFCRTFFRTGKLTLKLFAAMIVLSVIILNLIFHLLFETPYLMNRTILFLYPPLLISLFFMADSMMGGNVFNKMKYGLITVAAFMGVLIIFNFSKSFSVNTFKKWPIQADSKEGLDYLLASGAKNVGMSFWQQCALSNYYSPAFPEKYQIKCEIIPDITRLKVPDSTRLSRFDFLLVSPPCDTGLLSNDWLLVKSFPVSGLKVFERKKQSVLGIINPEY